MRPSSDRSTLRSEDADAPEAAGVGETDPVTGGRGAGDGRCAGFQRPDASVDGAQRPAPTARAVLRYEQADRSSAVSTRAADSFRKRCAGQPTRDVWANGKAVFRRSGMSGPWVPSNGKGRVLNHQQRDHVTDHSSLATSLASPGRSPAGSHAL